MSRKNIWHLPVAIIVVCVTMLFFGSISVSAEEYSGECGAEGDNLTWSFSEGTLTISGTGEMRYYQYGSAPWLINCGSSITKVVIEEGVTSVSAYAFYECRHIQSVSFPETLTSIGDNAFQCIDDLTYAPLPASLETIGKCAFNQTHLTSVNLGENVKTIGKGAFSGGFDLETVTISGKNLTSIGEGAFSSCQKLVTVTFSEDATCNIGDKMFESCISLESINIPGGAKSIGKEAFYYCQNLTGVTLPNGLVTIGNCAFEYSGIKTINIPESVTTIEWGAFSLSGLESITIPGTVKDIDASICYRCEKLKSVTLSEGVETIGYEAFRECPALENVSFPNSLTSIGESAFCQSGLTSVTISGSDLVINDYAFNACFALKSVKLDGVTKIKYGAFYYCQALETIEIPATVTEIGHYVFYECGAITDIYCYADSTLDWYYLYDGFDENFDENHKPTIHVRSSELNAYKEKFSSMNANFVGDLDSISSKIIGHSITLSDMIGVNFYLNLSSAENVTVTFNWGVGDYAKTAKGTLVPVNQYGANYKVTCGVAARCMIDDITMIVKCGDEEILRDSYKVIDYITVLGKTYPLDETLQQLLAALQDYGADSQRYFKYRDNLVLPDAYFTYRYDIISYDALSAISAARSDLENRTDLIDPDMPVKHIGDTRDIGLSYYGASAVCSSQTKIRLYFTVTDETKFAEVQAYYGSKALTFKNAKVGEQSVVYIETPGLVPDKLIAPIVFTIGGVDYEYDFTEYVGKCIAGSDYELHDVAVSLYLYGYFANQYKGDHHV